jgi:hypothetical protein
MEFAVLAPGEPTLLGRVMSEAAKVADDLEFDGVTYKVEWIVRELVGDQEGTAGEQARRAGAAARDALPAKAAGSRHEPLSGI